MKFSITNLFAVLLVMAAVVSIEAKGIESNDTKQFVFEQFDHEYDQTVLLAVNVEAGGYKLLVELPEQPEGAALVFESYVGIDVRVESVNYRQGNSINLASVDNDKANPIRGSPLVG